VTQNKAGGKASIPPVFAPEMKAKAADIVVGASTTTVCRVSEHLDQYGTVNAPSW
jgi:hypothetical protein